MMNARPHDQSAPDKKPAPPRVVVTTERRKPIDLTKNLLLDENGNPRENRRSTDPKL